MVTISAHIKLAQISVYLTLSRALARRPTTKQFFFYVSYKIIYDIYFMKCLWEHTHTGNDLNFHEWQLYQRICFNSSLTVQLTRAIKKKLHTKYRMTNRKRPAWLRRCAAFKRSIIFANVRCFQLPRAHHFLSHILINNFFRFPICGFIFLS